MTRRSPLLRIEGGSPLFLYSQHYFNQRRDSRLWIRFAESPLFWRKKPGFFDEYQQLSVGCDRRNPVSEWLRRDRLSGRLASGDET
ncbi:hypothetical protein [Planktothricoides raciborskii]|uniref:Uncharacterized protein n=1 Tax=Planktothricoides raciborskii FACHB-1370 TaxID=2949576 RepID=A0ABR8EAY4_9CYAN|nr:hypothetical protein [Planktothricoides raciborskii]MBD2542776.1 hypothetical protein [Planktothricoides raciborskii FACHB-1370]MBD2581477.1 hypothetical protein [Planktothricoides raciborskii FACHB-1261]